MLYKDQKINDYNLQFIKIYLVNNCLNTFDQQRALEEKYIAKNLKTNQKYKKYDKNNIKYKSNI